MRKEILKIQDLCKTYQVSGHELPVLKHLNLELDSSEISVILGRSGCGKTTLLRLIAGLEHADGDMPVYHLEDSENNQVTSENIKYGMIFQEPRLMPWLTVEDNILFGIGRAGKKQMRHLISLIGLEGFEKAYPDQLSGGMQQRVSLARALAYGADYLLMDEPFAALDYFTRRQMQKELWKIQQSEKTGVLFVTHSIDEALSIGARIMILEDGICKKEYDLKNMEFPRDLFSQEILQMKKDIENRLKREEI